MPLGRSSSSTEGAASSNAGLSVFGSPTRVISHRSRSPMRAILPKAPARGQPAGCRQSPLPARISTVGREGFEPSKAEPADLQSAPVGHLGTDPSADTIVRPSAAAPQGRIGATRLASVLACRASMSPPRSTCKRCATPSTRRAGRSPPVSTSRTPARASSSRDNEIQLNAPTEDRRRALVQVLEEKLVRRQVSLKALSYGKIEEASTWSAATDGQP